MDSASRTVERQCGSNVPGHEEARCLVADGDSDRLVADMMQILRSMSDVAYVALKESYDDVFEALEDAKTTWDDQEEAATARWWVNCTDDSINYPCSVSIQESTISTPSKHF